MTAPISMRLAAYPGWYSSSTMPGGETYLVAVGGVASRRRLSRCGAGAVFRESSRITGTGGISRAGHAHGGINIGAPGQRVTDGSADAGCSTAERLDLSRMVVRLVLEQQQPVLVVTRRGSTVILTVQALISSDSSSFCSLPAARRHFPASVAMSIRLRGFVRPSLRRVSS